MKLPGKLRSLFDKNKQEKNLFFAVLFEKSQITASVFLSRVNETEIIAFKSTYFTGSVSESVNVLDKLLTELADEDPRVENIENTIFGFPQEFLTDGEIKGNIKKQLKEVVEKLSLVPCGYVVISEALAYFLSSKAGTQESAIFVGVSESEIHISLVKIGNIVDEKTTARTDNICSDLETVLNSFQQEVLPAKIVLYDNTQDLSQIKSKFLNYEWENKCNFLHFPKIELLPAFSTLQAVVSAYTKQETNMVHESGFAKTKELEQPQTFEPKKRFSLLGIKSKLPKFSMGFSKKYLFVFAMLVLFTAGGIALTRLYTPPVKIRILVNQETHKQRLDFTLDPDAKEVDIQKRIIPGKKVSVELEGEAKKQTTGTKLIGEAAEGTITIYNKTTKPKTFPAGTILIAQNNLKFSLNEDTKVASASEQVGGLTYGKKDTNVKAKEIGPKGNISSGSKLIFEDYAENKYSALAKQDFSGGKSREVSVVSKDDAADLRKEIIKKLESEAKKKLSAQKQGSLSLIEDTLEEKFAKEVLSDKIGEQAKEVSLKGNVVFTALAYDREDISKLLQKNAQKEIKKGYKVKNGVVGQKILKQELNKDGSVSFSAEFSMVIVPEINPDNLRERFAGKSVGELKKEAGDTQIGEIEVLFSNKIPFIKPKNLPKDADKIQITILPR